MFINYHGIMKFKREISKFSYYNDLNLLIIRMRLFHFKPSVTGTKQDKEVLNFFVVHVKIFI